MIDLAEDHIDITSGFTGKVVTVFGAADQDGDIAIVLRGPERRVVLRKKEPVFGMWVNRRFIEFKNVPAFYAYAVSRSETRMADPATLRDQGIGLNALDFTSDDDDRTMVAEFQESLIRTQQAKGLFPLMPQQIRFLGQHLFRTSFYLPADVPVGTYRAQAYLLKDGTLIDTRTIDLTVAQAGLSANIVNFAVHYSLAYALLGLAMALGAGVWAFWMSRRQRA